MTTYNTGNPIGSVEEKDFYDNVQNLDNAVNTTSDHTWTDRLGNTRKTWLAVEESAPTATAAADRAEAAAELAMQGDKVVYARTLADLQAIIPTDPQTPGVVWDDPSDTDENPINGNYVWDGSTWERSAVQSVSSQQLQPLFATKDIVDEITFQSQTDFFLEDGVENGYVNKTGSFVSSASWRTTAFVPYNSRSKYVYTGYGSTVACAVSGWDENLQFVEDVYSASGQVVAVPISTSNPAVKYLRASSGAEPYTRKFEATAHQIDEAAIPGVLSRLNGQAQDIAATDDRLNDLTESSSVDYAQSPDVRIGYINLSGVFVNSANWRTTPRIDVINGATYRFTGYGTPSLVASVSMWDADDNYLGAAYLAPSAQNNNVLVTISNPSARYVRATSAVLAAGNPYTFAFVVEAELVRGESVSGFQDLKDEVNELSIGSLTAVRSFAPTEAHAVIGETLYINARGIVPDKAIDLAWNITNSNDIRLAIAPTTTSDIQVRLRAMGHSGADMEVCNFPVRVAGTIASPSGPQNFIHIGDSTVEGTGSGLSGPIVNELSRRLTGIGTEIFPAASPGPRALTNLYFRGTLGSAPVKHEGRGGWQISDYLNSASIGGVANAFWNPGTSSFDIDYYLAQNGFRAEDQASGVLPDGSNLTLLVQCIWNDVYSIGPQQSAVFMGQFIDAVKAKKPQTRFIISGLNPPPLLNDKSWQGATRYVSQQQIFDIAIRQVGEAYAAMIATKSNVSWLNLAHQFDPEIAYEVANRTTNRRKTTQTPMVTDHVHPIANGYAQWADAWYFKILYDYCRAS